MSLQRKAKGVVKDVLFPRWSNYLCSHMSIIYLKSVQYCLVSNVEQVGEGPGVGHINILGKILHSTFKNKVIDTDPQTPKFWKHKCISTDAGRQAYQLIFNLLFTKNAL